MLVFYARAPVVDTEDNLWIMEQQKTRAAALTWKRFENENNEWEIVGNKCVPSGYVEKSTAYVYDVLEPIDYWRRCFFIFEDDDKTIKDRETKEVIFDKSVIKFAFQASATIFITSDNRLCVFDKTGKRHDFHYDTDMIVDVIICLENMFILKKDGKIDRFVLSKSVFVIEPYNLEDVYVFANFSKQAFIANTTDGKTWLCNEAELCFFEIPFIDLKSNGNHCLYKNANKHVF